MAIDRSELFSIHFVVFIKLQASEISTK